MTPFSRGRRAQRRRGGRIERAPSRCGRSGSRGGGSRRQPTLRRRRVEASGTARPCGSTGRGGSWGTASRCRAFRRGARSRSRPCLPSALRTRRLPGQTPIGSLRRRTGGSATSRVPNCRRRGRHRATAWPLRAPRRRSQPRRPGRPAVEVIGQGQPGRPRTDNAQVRFQCLAVGQFTRIDQHVITF